MVTTRRPRQPPIAAGASHAGGAVTSPPEGQGNQYVAHCVELLAPLGPVRVRRMFGGHGIYLDELFVALVSGDCLYLKADSETEGRFRDAGCVPFSYEAKGNVRMTLAYWSVPDDAMEAPPAMAPWARLAVAAAVRARAGRKATSTARRGKSQSTE